MRQPKIFITIREYSWSLFRQDALAGLTVALVALPLSIAIAIASGASPAQGLVTAIIGGFVISLTSGRPRSCSAARTAAAVAGA